MNGVEATLRRAVADLDSARANWVLVGGFAVSAWAEPRLTRDVDVAVAVNDDSAAEALVADLAARGCRALAAVEQDAVGRLATVRLALVGSRGSGAVLAVLFASRRSRRAVAGAAEVVERVAARWIELLEAQAEGDDEA